MSDPWKLDLPASVVLKAIAPGLQVPKRWTAQEFARQGQILIVAMVRASRLTTKKAFPFVARAANKVFARQLDAIIAKVLAKAGRRSAKESVEIAIDPGAHEALWVQAINEVMQEQGIDLVAELIPPIQSVMGQSYGRISALMGQPTTVTGHQIIARQARSVASRIVNINDTTRKVIEGAVRGSIGSGLTVTETAAKLRETMPALSRSRVNTIARTELSNAWHEGAKTSFQESETLTHVSVIGCESREEDRWDSPSYQQFMYNGESTCNAVDVPVQDMDKLNFHPNHTGTTIPSRFRNADGSVEAV
jgi:hypothetical protein